MGFHVTSANTTANVNINAQGWLADLLAGTGGAPGIASLLPAGVLFQTITTYLIDPATNRALSVVQATTGAVGTSVSPSLPQSTSVVCSLRTDNPARDGRGRFYLPPCASNVLSATGELLTASRDAIADSLAQAFFTDITSAGDSLVVWSITAHASFPVRKLMVGTVIDSQDRRQNKLVTARVSRTVV